MPDRKKPYSTPILTELPARDCMSEAKLCGCIVDMMAEVSTTSRATAKREFEYAWQLSHLCWLGLCIPTQTSRHILLALYDCLLDCV